MEEAQTPKYPRSTQARASLRRYPLSAIEPVNKPLHDLYRHIFHSKERKPYEPQVLPAAFAANIESMVQLRLRLDIYQPIGRSTEPTSLLCRMHVSEPAEQNAAKLGVGPFRSALPARQKSHIFI